MIKVQENDNPMIINVLGTPYKILFTNKIEERGLEQANGFVDVTRKEIVIDNEYDEDVCNVFSLNYFQKKVLRHEIVHAFLYESGLSNASWGENEEIVDWIAIQSPKIFHVFQQLASQLMDDDIIERTEL